MTPGAGNWSNLPIRDYSVIVLREEAYSDQSEGIVFLVSHYLA